LETASRDNPEAEANSPFVTRKTSLKRPGSMKPFGSITSARNGAALI
jgi:hypothetical protein